MRGRLAETGAGGKTETATNTCRCGQEPQTGGKGREE
jgi:hypothetical protein